ncbi:MAG: two-component regulator propeller domain-containing protein, partial [Saprospiraceae bacterium]
MQLKSLVRCIRLLNPTLFLLFTLHSAAQADSDYWKIQHISTEAGLSNRFVNSIITDSRGFIWISTNFGLNRYDGHHFDVLTKESKGLKSNTMFSLYEDVNENIWV